MLDFHTKLLTLLKSSPEEVSSWVELDPSVLEGVVATGSSLEESYYPVPVSDMERVMSVYLPTARFVDIKIGPTLVTYLFELPLGTSGISLVRRSRDLSRDLGIDSLRVVPHVPGTSYCGVEVPNNAPYSVPFKDAITLLSSKSDRKPLEVVLGQDSVGSPLTLDLSTMPHLLVAGTTGSGKSVFLNSVICSLVSLNSPSSVKLRLVDPKQVEFDVYSDLPHLDGVPVANTLSEADAILDSAIEEMEIRLRSFKAAGVRSLESFNEARLLAGLSPLPYQVLIVDEFADLMLMDKKMSSVFESKVVRIAQKARAAGIHMIIATQKPIVRVVTGLIKGNLPSRISFKVPSSTDSRVILDSNGAEDLLGRGDMLISNKDFSMKRAQGVWIDDNDIQTVLAFAGGA